MSSDEARELFSAAIDGDLDPGLREAFDAALDSDATLAGEYREFSAFCAELRRAPQLHAAAPDILPGVQRRLRARSHGRFYADRFSERLSASLHPVLTLGVLMLVLLVLAWLGWSLLWGWLRPLPGAH